MDIIREASLYHIHTMAFQNIAYFMAQKVEGREKKIASVLFKDSVNCYD
jgi:hypothetical protein